MPRLKSRVRVSSLAPGNMTYTVKIGQRAVFKTSKLTEAYKVIRDILNKGQTDVYLYGGRIGSWR